MNPSAPGNETDTRGPVFIESKGFQLAVLALDGGIVEYRVERVSAGWRLPVWDVVFMAVVAYVVEFVVGGYMTGWSFTPARSVILGLAFLSIWSRFTEVHSDSVFALPAIGLQLETRRGLSLFDRRLITSVSRVFIPISAISDIIINEGLCGWNVKRYLAVLPSGEPRLQVVFEALDPPFSILKEVYHGLRETLFQEWDEES